MKQLDLYPAVPGFKDTDTSKAAAEEMKPSAGTLRAACLQHVEYWPDIGCTADECATRMGESVLTIRPRFSELKMLGKIEDTGERRPNASGKSAIVWRAKP